MRNPNRLYRCVFLSMAVAAIIGPPTSARADLGALVPAYFYPGTGGPGGVGDGWAAMTAAASQIPVTAIFNPNSGPLPGPADPNYVNAMSNLENAGGSVVAYIPTFAGSTPIGDPTTPGTIEYDINTYINQYGSLIHGFFIDQMSILPGTLSYYDDLYNYIKGLPGSYTVVGNPGIPFLNGVTPAQFLSTADVLNIFEGPNNVPLSGGAGFNPTPGAPNGPYPYTLNWFQSYPSNRFSNIVYDVPPDAGNPSTSSAMLADLSKAVQLNAGQVYITDQTLPNPYAQLPSYWDQEVRAISVPEPGPLTKLASAGLFWVVAVAARRLGRRRVRV